MTACLRPIFLIHKNRNMIFESLGGVSFCFEWFGFLFNILIVKVVIYSWGIRTQPAAVLIKSNIPGTKTHIVYLIRSAWRRVLSFSNRRKPLLGSLSNTIERLNPELKEKRAHFYRKHDRIIVSLDSHRPCAIYQNSFSYYIKIPKIG